MDFDNPIQAGAWDEDGMRPPCLFRLNEHVESEDDPKDLVSVCLRDKNHSGPHLFGRPDREVSELMGL